MVGLHRITRCSAPLLWLAALICSAAAYSQPEPVPEKYLTIQEGTLPIIVTAPHAGGLTPPDVPERTDSSASKFVVVRDTNTDILAERTAREIEKKMGGKPYLIVAHFARKCLDVNRAPADAYELQNAKRYYEAYHEAIRRACREIETRWRCGLLIDIHGQAADADSVFRGTNNGATVAAIVDRSGAEAYTGPNSLLGQLEKREYKLVPACGSPDREDSRFNGGYTVATYGGKQRAYRGFAAIQLEFGGKYRAKKQLDTTATDLAEAVQVFAKAYLPPPK